MKTLRSIFALALFLPIAGAASDKERLKLSDLFELEHAADPQISPDGRSISPSVGSYEEF